MKIRLHESKEPGMQLKLVTSHDGTIVFIIGVTERGSHIRVGSIESTPSHKAAKVSLNEAFLEPVRL